MEGPYTVPPPARAALASTYISSGNLTLANYISRSQARITVSCCLLGFVFLTAPCCVTCDSDMWGLPVCLILRQDHACSVLTICMSGTGHIVAHVANDGFSKWKSRGKGANSSHSLAGDLQLLVHCMSALQPSFDRVLFATLALRLLFSVMLWLL